MPDHGEGDAQPWEIFGERSIYDSRWAKLSLVDVQPPGLERFEHHVVRLHRVAVAAVIDEADRVLMLRRYRFIPGRAAWELPGGLVDDGEEAADAARREVEEETGWRPVELRHLITYQPMIGMVDSPHEIFLGRGAVNVGAPTDPEESGPVAWLPLRGMPDLLARGELAGSGTLVAVLHLMAGLLPDRPGT